MTNKKNKKDMLILTCLRANARETLTSISKKTRIPISTIYERLKVQESGVIKKHTSLLDFSTLGFMTWVMVAVKSDREQRQELSSYLSKHTNINSLFKINNGYDFLIEGVFRHIKDLEDFMETLETKFNIKEKQVFYLINELKRESFLEDPSSIDFIMN